MQAVYKRVIIKLSGEALAGANGNGIDEKVLDQVTNQIIEVSKLGVEIGIIVGGGNFWRGRQGREMDRSTADHMVHSLCSMLCRVTGCIVSLQCCSLQ